MMMEAPAVQNLVFVGLDQVQPAKVRSGKDMVIVRNVDKLPELRRWEDGKGLIHLWPLGRLIKSPMLYHCLRRGICSNRGVFVCRNQQVDRVATDVYKVHCLSLEYHDNIFQQHWEFEIAGSLIIQGPTSWIDDFRTGCLPKSLSGSMLKMQRRRGNVVKHQPCHIGDGLILAAHVYYT